MSLVVYFISFFLFWHQTGAAVSTLTAPPPDPSFATETHDLTLVWNYTLDGSVAFAQFLNITGGGSGERIARQLSQGGSVNVEPKYQDRFSVVITDSQASLTIRGVQTSDQGKYQFSLSPTGTGNILDDVEVIVQVPSKIVLVSPVEGSVKERSDLNLYCGASGRPAPNITWIRVFENGSESQVLYTGASWNFVNINKTDAGKYRCTANNGVGSSVNRTITVIVSFSPKLVEFVPEYKVAVQQSVTLRCQAEGYPEPTFSWSPCSNDCNTGTLTIPEVLNDTVYTCTATNSEGSDSAETSVVIAGEDINITVTIKDGDCSDEKYNKSSLSTKLPVTIKDVFANESDYLRTTVNKVSCGSVIVDLTLSFNTTVTERRIINILKDAARDGKLGDFNVDASSIKGTRPEIPVTTPPGIKTTPKPHKDDYVTIIIAVVVSVAVLAIIGVAVFCVYKKKKDKKNDNKGKRTDGNARVIVPWKPNRQEKVTA